MANNKLNLGCGKDWQKYYPLYEGLDIQRFGQTHVGDVLEVLPHLAALYEGQYQEVMANHFLEHFDHNELSHIFTQVHRILMPQGLFRIVVPHKDNDRAYVLGHKTIWTETTFRSLAEDKDTMFGEWQVKELATNKRQDISCLLEKI